MRLTVACVRSRVVQNRYNLSERRYEDVVDYCADQGIVFVPFFPLRGRRARTHRDRRTTPGDAGTDHPRVAAPSFEAMLPIPGTLSLEHARENLAALELESTDEEFESLR